MEACNTSPADGTIVFEPCKFCGRTFNPTSLERHEKVCEKTKTKQRKVFDSFQQRAKAISAIPAKSVKEEKNAKPKGKWKVQHEELIRTVRNGKLEPSSPQKCSDGRPQQKVIPLGYTQCPVCRRCFNQKAADRHISWCKEQLSRLPKNLPSSEALTRLKARVQYRAPLPKRKQNSHAEGQRLVRSAESHTCKSEAVQWAYCSPWISRSRPSTKQAEVKPESTFRRRSCERSTFTKEVAEQAYKNYITLPLKRTQSSPYASVRFKEKFPNYQNSRKPCVSNGKLGIYSCEDRNANMKRGKSFDALHALQLQLAELQVVERDIIQGKDLNLPLMSPSQVSPSRKMTCDTLVISHSEDNGSLPTVKQTTQLPPMPRFCYQCGTKYPVQSAKYCCECGVKRLVLSPDGNAKVF